MHSPRSSREEKHGKLHTHKTNKKRQRKHERKFCFAGFEGKGDACEVDHVLDGLMDAFLMRTYADIDGP